MTETDALNAARKILGRRAIVESRPDGNKVVARPEVLITGRRHVREYGVASTWAEAVEKAGEAYRAMWREP